MAIQFFNAEDFDNLKKFSGKSKDKSNEEMLEVYDSLKETYLKVEYWADKVKERLFPDGHVHILKKPTNQANIFQAYLWAKIYPDERSWEIGELAFTLGIDDDFKFEIKIDTVGLGDRNSKRLEYMKERGEKATSPIVNMFNGEDILSKNWDGLIELSVKSISGMKPEFDRIHAKFWHKSTVHVLSEVSLHNFPLNTILYGPPGTGKTYNTIARAISIANPNFSFTDESKIEKSRKEIKEEFERLKNDEQIVFSSFHQSMSYEDFIEGIKPLKPQPGEGLSYEVKNGIFKRISKLAQSNYEQSKESNKNIVPFEDVFQQLKDEWERSPDMKFPLKTKGYDYTIIGFTDTSIQFKKASGGTGHTLSINTLMELYYGKDYDFKQGVGIYYPAILTKLKTFISTNPLTDRNKNILKNYVLVIDEINRGNISQIFGELISLIEDDKRLGMPEALSAILPYSKEEAFSVPPNLYILGTMNTADRSVEALDTALRRRFSFEFMPPIEGLVAEELDEVPLRNIFMQINERIAFLLDKDHQIGHSYLMKVKELEELKDVFKNKIIPLLREYFFNEDRKIYLVLGEGFVKKSNYRPKFPVNDNEEMARDIYTLIPIDESFNITNALMKTLVTQ